MKETKLTFREQIAKLRRDAEDTRIADQAEKQHLQDEADTKAAISALFANNVKMPAGEVVAVQDDRIVVKLEPNLIAEFPMESIDDEGKLSVKFVRTLEMREGKRDFHNVKPQVGQRGLLDRLGGGVYTLILDTREAA